MRSSSNFIFTITLGFVTPPLRCLNMPGQGKCKSRPRDGFGGLGHVQSCDSLRGCGGRCHTAWRSPPASASGSRPCRPDRSHSSNLLTKHSRSHSGAFPQASRSHILATSFHGKVNIPQPPARLSSCSGMGWWEGLTPQTGSAGSSECFREGLQKAAWAADSHCT